jgi:hypothetical protein
MFADDPLDEFLQQDQVQCSDAIDDSLRSLALATRKPGSASLDVSIEQISNLENLASSAETDLSLRASGLSQLTELLLLSRAFETDFARACGVKQIQLNSFWGSVVESLFKLL